MLRLPFTGASLLPFLYGYLAPDGAPVDAALLAPGALGVALTHLSANVVNDVGDADTGADAADTTFYGFFGGSKLIQQGRATRRLYLRTALLLAVAAGGAACLVALRLAHPAPAAVWAALLAAAWAYSLPPARLCYRRLGEVTVFLLFGPACVLGGVYLRRQAPPAVGDVALALPQAFFVTAILVVNEIPDAGNDRRAGKHNLVNRGGRGWGVAWFLALNVLGLLSVAAAAAHPAVSRWTLTALAAAVPGGLAVRAARRARGEPAGSVTASRLAIQAHAVASAGLIAGALW